MVSETTPKPATTTVETVPAEADVYSKMKFSFEVQSIGAALYKGESEMVSFGGNNFIVNIFLSTDMPKSSIYLLPKFDDHGR